jgi:vancomycin resistance protein VanW
MHKAITVKKVKRNIKVLLRLTADVWQGTYFKFAKKNAPPAPFTYALSITQHIKPSATFSNKLYNLRLASGKISRYVVMPGQVFSFWHIVGNPGRQFKKSRSIINGSLSEEAGGGLCQVSGIVYYAALQAGLHIVERHNHSVDIYTDETRFTPLGTDATVVYGYKDLRVRNNFSFPVRFCLEVSGSTITVHLQAPQKLHTKTLFFNVGQNGSNTVVTLFDEHKTQLNRSEYKAMAN